ncbi:MAG: hypothetical protein NZO58_14020 [Gemmataceae bacterium]|nr:hypothetical protein [Gemmataceae bacterium]
MKAEHRKELETNALADRMGRLLQSARQTPQRSAVWYFITAVVAALVVVLAYRYWHTKKRDNSEAWVNYYLQGPHAKDVAENFADRPQGKAVKFDLYGQLLWETITQLGTDPKGRINRLRQLSGLFENLRDECEKEPILQAEAMYALAVIDETLAIEDRANLDSATERYKELKQKHGDTVYGKLAAERLKILEDETANRELRDLYQTLQIELKVDRKKGP